MFNGVCLQAFELICYFKTRYPSFEMLVHSFKISANDSF